MSRRRQSRAIETTQAVDASERWWADTPTSRVPENWQDAWGEITLDVVHRVWSRQGASIYFQPRDRWLRDDLRGWLTIEAARLASTYQPSETSEAPERLWGAYLWKTLNYRARYHFGNVVGAGDTPTGQAARDAHIRGIDSLDRQDAVAAETGYRPALHALHGQDFFAQNPETIIIKLEDMDQHIREAEDWQKVVDANQGVYRVESSVCEITGCSNPTFQTRTVCRRHFDQERNLWREPSEVECNIPECHRPVNAVGLCGPHMARYYKGRLDPELHQYVAAKVEPKSAQVCSVEGCEDVVGPKGAKGLCSKHYSQWRRDSLKVEP